MRHLHPTIKHASISLLLGLIILILGLTIPVQGQQPMLNLSAGWQYRWGDSPVDDKGLRLWLSDSADNPAWQYMTEEAGQPPDRQRNKILWLRVQLPVDTWPDPALSLDAVDQGLEAYLKQELIYIQGQVDRSGDDPALATIHHMIRLPDGYQGKMLTLRMYSQYSTIGPRGGIFIGSRADHILTILSNDIDRFILGCLFIMIGLIATGFFLRRPEQRVYLALALFSASSGFYTLWRTNYTRRYVEKYGQLWLNCTFCYIVFVQFI